MVTIDKGKVVMKAFAENPSGSLRPIPLETAIERSVVRNGFAASMAKLISILAAKGLMTADEVNEFISYPYSIES